MAEIIKKPDYAQATKQQNLYRVASALRDILQAEKQHKLQLKQLKN